MVMIGWKNKWSKLLRRMWVGFMIPRFYIVKIAFEIRS